MHASVFVCISYVRLVVIYVVSRSRGMVVVVERDYVYRGEVGFY